MQSTGVHEKKLPTDLQGGSGGRKSARWGRAEHVKFKRKAKGWRKQQSEQWKFVVSGEEKGVKKEVSFHSRRQMKAADGRRLFQTTEAAPCWDCPGSAVQGSAPSPPTSTRLSHPGRTPPARCPLVLHAHTHTHTRVKHTQSGQRFHHLFIFSGLGGKKLPTTTFWQTWQKISQQCIWVQVSYRQPACWWGQTTQLHATC